MDEATRRAVDKIEKLMRLAGSNPNEQEAASALAKAQELLLAYNLDMAVVEQAAGQSGKRVDEQVSGGMHRYQRELWRHIAELNFCMYWTQKERVKEGSRQAKMKRRWTHEHRLVGRTINVTQTRNMATYINGTIERLCRERLGGDGKQFFSRDAVAYREGIADRVIEKIEERREDFIKKERKEAAEAARKAAAAGVSLSTAMTVAGLQEIEDDGNYDFIHGDGAAARKRAADAEWAAGRAKRRQAQAEANARAEKEYAEWAAAHPEEAAAERKKEAARQRAADRRAANGGGRGRYRFRETAADHRRGSGEYHAGYKAGEGVGIDPQTEGGSRKAIK